jgi:hypothetical protein
LQHCDQETANSLLDSSIFVIKKDLDKFSGYSADGILRNDLSLKILSKQVNETAHIYDIININIEK